MKNKKNSSIKDSRGAIYEFFKDEFQFQQVNILLSKKGSKRGEHYHQRMREYFFLISGDIKVEIGNLKTKEREFFNVSPGESFVVEPFNIHTIYFEEDSELLVMYSDEFDESDLYKD